MSKNPVKNVEFSFLKETNVEFAKQGLPGTIKFAEGLYRYEPNSFYASKLAFLYSAYSFGFFDQSPFDDLDESSEELKSNMLDFYDRGYKYGFISLDLNIKDFSKRLLKRDYSVLDKIKKKNIEALFWLTFSWSMKILNNTADPLLVSQLNIVKHIMDKIKEIDPEYMNGGVNALYVAYYGGRTPVIGGDTKKAEKYYKAGQKFSKRSLILDYVYFRYVSTQKKDSKEFDTAHKKIESSALKGKANDFINNLIKLKAKKLYSKKEDIF